MAEKTIIGRIRVPLKRGKRSFIRPDIEMLEEGMGWDAEYVIVEKKYGGMEFNRPCPDGQRPTAAILTLYKTNEETEV